MIAIKSAAFFERPYLRAAGDQRRLLGLGEGAQSCLPNGFIVF